MEVIMSIEAIKYPLTGIGRYAFELTKQLQHDASLDLKLFSHGKFIAQLPELVSVGSESSFLSKIRGQLIKSDMAVKSVKLVRDYAMRKSLRTHKNAIFHGPAYYLPKFDGQSVATFHDLSVFTMAEYHPPARVRFMQKELRHTLQQASILITDSEFNRIELADYFGYPTSKIVSVPLACSEEFHPRDAASTDPVLSRFGLNHGGYTLYAGTIEPRKNIETLLDAYSALPDAVRRRWPLVLVGHQGWQSNQLHERIEKAVSEGWAKYLGYVKNDDLPYLFAGAHLFCFPSHYEGFGLPVLEAMASGVPVVSSNASSLPEVAGDAALLFAPTDVDTLRQLIMIGLEDEVWRETAKQKGLMEAATFSWQRCAEETVAVYRKLTTGKQE
jgi:alpha-1,3-rhamnosyl/mannosyltransferase